MNLCAECRKTLWPFFFALFIASFAGFLTWLTLSYSNLGGTERIGWALGVFAATGATLVHYVMSCMRRHCRHGREVMGGHQHRPARG